MLARLFSRNERPVEQTKEMSLMRRHNEQPDNRNTNAPVRIEQWMIDEAAKLDPVFREIACKGVDHGVFRLE